jgi:hypothetical protein
MSEPGVERPVSSAELISPGTHSYAGGLDTRETGGVIVLLRPNDERRPPAGWVFAFAAALGVSDRFDSG